MAYQPDASTRYCNWTYVNQKDLPAGQKLLQCGRCKEVFYISKEAQTLHWKQSHKKTCKRLEDEPDSIRSGMDYDACVRTLRTILRNPMQLITGRTLLHAIKSLEAVLLDSSFYVPQHESIQSQLVKEVFVRMFTKLSSYNGESGESCLSLLWSAPGFASHFLSDDGNIILSAEMRRQKKLGQSVERKIAYNQPPQCYDPNFHLPKPIWSLYSVLYVIPWTLMPDANTHTLFLAVACARKAMAHAKCPYARMSYPSLLETDDSQSGDPISTRSEFYLQFMAPFFGSNRGRMISRLG